MTKKRLIRINERKIDESNEDYSRPAVNFAFVSSPATDRTQCTGLVTCRETLNNVGHLIKTKTVCSYHNYEQDAPVDFEKLRLLIVKDPTRDDEHDFKIKLFSGKTLLNHYEKRAGWGLSKITTVKHPNYKNAWLLTGPKEWMSQPQLLSIATIFIRLMSIHGPLNMNGTFQQAKDSLKELYDNYIESKKNEKIFNYYSDIEHYLVHLDNIELLITNTEEVFSDISLDEAWLADKNSCFSIYSGISSFFKTHLVYNKKIDIIQKNFAVLKKSKEK